MSEAKLSERPGAGLVSIVLPTYKRGDFLGRAIASVLSQTYRYWELLVVDDNDPESEHRRETELFMANFSNDDRVSYLKHDRNRGGAAARNTGIQRASGEYVAFLDDDDVWEPNKLERQVQLLAESPKETGMVYCGYRRVNLQTGRSVIFVPDARNHSLANLLRENGIGTTSAILCRREVLLEVGGFDEELPSRQDIDLYVRLARCCRFDFVPEPLLSWYRHEGEAIGKNRKRSIEAHKRFLAKYRELLEQYPEANSYRHYRLGLLLVFEDRLAEAREAFARAWLLSPANARAALWWGVANPLAFRVCKGASELRAKLRSGRLQEVT